MMAFCVVATSLILVTMLVSRLVGLDAWIIVLVNVCLIVLLTYYILEAVYDLQQKIDELSMLERSRR